jgi:hypothetical protein
VKSYALVLRLFLTALLVSMVYREAGIWTGTAVGLLALANELQVIAINQIWRRLPAVAIRGRRHIEDRC